ncbi:MAG: SRPBCC family protein [Proteobacteria bacterium]|nr:SRPBCC family protein [Pseudomonadota bacterium]
MSDTIEKDVFINAPQSRVWRALTDHHQFGEWFGARLDEPFRAGGVIRGQITICGFEHVKFDASIVEMTPETRFVYRWHPYAVDPDIDYSRETPTTVALELSTEGQGTRLRVRESGFNAIPAHRKAEALRANTHGWEHQLGNIARYAEG